MAMNKFGSPEKGTIVFGNDDSEKNREVDTDDEDIKRENKKENFDAG